GTGDPSAGPARPQGTENRSSAAFASRLAEVVFGIMAALANRNIPRGVLIAPLSRTPRPNQINRLLRRDVATALAALQRRPAGYILALDELAVADTGHGRSQCSVTDATEKFV